MTLSHVLDRHFYVQRAARSLASVLLPNIVNFEIPESFGKVGLLVWLRDERRSLSPFVVMSSYPRNIGSLRKIRFDQSIPSEKKLRLAVYIS